MVPPAPPPASDPITALLSPFQRFGVRLDLERVEHLLAQWGNPHHRVPIVHVAGTNGKGSVCAYLSSILTAAGYRTGRYTSPHLISWTERICLNDTPIAVTDLTLILTAISQRLQPHLARSHNPAVAANLPTLFEVLTTAAWIYFAQQQVDIAVIEVGLGGRLDATNVCDRPLVSVITSLSREHWQVLGPTLADIAREKAGILKAGCPAVIGPLPDEAMTVVQAKARTLGCPVVWVQAAEFLGERGAGHGARARPADVLGHGSGGMGWARAGGLEYPLPLAGEFQLINSAIAIATIQQLRHQGWRITDAAIQTGMAHTHWPGRIQWTTWQGQPLLVDGAHNAAAAIVLRTYLDRLLDKGLTSLPRFWIIGMLATKEHDAILSALLHPRSPASEGSADALYLVPIPGHHSADPEALATLARSLCPNLRDCRTCPDLSTALAMASQARRQFLAEHAVAAPGAHSAPLVLCGSLYLVGQYLRTFTQQERD
ncbi:bifunctional folylpolyglutamate synthase/dihydrofolate synthase [Trichothermofontia sichuanensis B231]|uniref:bifunctional folylpolyglutamate synthase/dihydrofolate synthase n=1 Tax=Trichothermofontia sichuanensis TaxID=3045816 RepID=UPI0022463494|nr:folylpolyglutamate synthase/dihydrofolate synthase family protein [Trichothermofontia sichuanensis]UZQ52786.1 bifunctional folylpolyglutamate synthase/dihydrofolate synthase [Trichothermofontia sichuanensis B231]